MILPCFYIFVHDVEAGHELAKPYGMNTPPSFFQNSTERGTALGPLFRETYEDPNQIITLPLSSIQCLEIAAIILVVSMTVLAVRKKPQTESMHLERS